MLLSFGALAQSNARYEDGKPQYRVVAVERSAEATESVSNSAAILITTRVFIPSAFTPDHDGINDEFGAVGMNLENYNLQIYDRWGEKVFESNQPDFKWDGTVSGSAPQSGVYLYQFQAKDIETGRVISTSGSVTLYI